ncbi:hypothetical protein [Ferrimonas aestuarii]|uniref:Uncharacterized protein n=1 Tax=Ferrimonas aestuarii TaxID=2569539 RepID=A0A4U1BRL0_9GAMM|nr:hypothetical protein [Ferrimonas aestuarii]TKB57410.1 hypothetical protein FCL42_03805 [Ferrimonas aestuarii]
MLIITQTDRKQMNAKLLKELQQYVHTNPNPSYGRVWLYAFLAILYQWIPLGLIGVVLMMLIWIVPGAAADNYTAPLVVLIFAAMGAVIYRSGRIAYYWTWYKLKDQLKE